MLKQDPLLQCSTVPDLFGQQESLVYYHGYNVTTEVLADAVNVNPLFEIDLAWAHSAFQENVVIGSPFIGHPEEFYTVLGNHFPSENVTLAEFQEFLQEYSNIKLLIDIKDDTTYKGSAVLEDLLRSVGVNRCIVHAFMSNWTVQPQDQSLEPHVYREDVDLNTLDKVLGNLGVPLIANCRGFNNDHLAETHVVDKMINDAKQCESIVSLGIYFPAGSHMPHTEYLKSINDAGYWAWVNGNNCALDNKSCCNSSSDSIVKSHSKDFHYVFEAYSDNLRSCSEEKSAQPVQQNEVQHATSISTTDNDNIGGDLTFPLLVDTHIFDDLKSLKTVRKTIWNTLRLITMSDELSACTRFD